MKIKEQIFTAETGEIFHALDQELRLQRIIIKRRRNIKPKNDLETLHTFLDTAISLRLVLIEEKLKKLKQKYAK
jgi:hypothetical protein